MRKVNTVSDPSANKVTPTALELESWLLSMQGKYEHYARQPDNSPWGKATDAHNAQMFAYIRDQVPKIFPK